MGLEVNMNNPVIIKTILQTIIFCSLFSIFGIILEKIWKKITKKEKP